ncbi:hypothetical protein [Brachyspira hampsonii]|uniref:hypothetical protein n=1 Tax=Brachyspira hampsonii TaxID=1287055 RepID=UPI0003499F78|nr:hypothetical protein [Brachyspira hampsonii]
MDYYSNNTLEKPFYNGMQCEFNEAKELYHKFINDIETEYVLALNSSMYPIEDIRAFNEFIDSLGIQNLVFKKNIMATNSKNIRDNYTNINDFSIKEIRDLNINLKHSIFDDNIIHNGKFKKFIIVGDSLDDNDNIIDFSKKNKGNYIVFSPNFSVLAYNAYLSFPISYLGEFEGHYVDNHGKVKEMHSFLEKNKNRMSLRDLLKYLYL